jgi:short subunit dehydrogenase-like uncharacterized protein
VTGTLVLVGATGYTAQLVVERLRERGIPFLATGRDTGRVRSVLEAAGGVSAEARRVDLADPVDVEWLARPGHVVLSCVGPYSLYGRGLAEAVARRGATYVDITGEEAFVAYSQQNLHAHARVSGALLLHSCAFESLPAVMLASALCRRGEKYLEIASYYRVAGHAMSPGTELTMKLASHWPTTRLHDGQFISAAPGSWARELELPFLPDSPVAVFAPYPEIRLWPRVHDTSAAASFLAMGRGEAALLTAKRAEGAPAIDGRRQRPVEEVVVRHAASRRRGPTAEERSRQAFDIAVVAATDGDREAAHLQGVDPYGLTAAIAVWVCEQLMGCDAGGCGAAGVCAPSEIFSFDQFIEMARAFDPELTVARSSLPPISE